MNIQLQSVHIKRFKGIENAPFDVSSINVFIGANNAGKSTLAQVIHFSVGILQTVELAKKWGSKEEKSLTLNSSELLYSPCADLYALGHGGQLLETENKAIEAHFTLTDGENISLIIRKGRNKNINVTVKNVSAAKRMANLETPFTIYSPGLAGIAKHEEYISNGVLLRTIARGDANLVFRNILLRLSKDENAQAWTDFIEDLRKLFNDIAVSVSYDYDTDEHIMVYANTGNGQIPVELAGTGVLQAIHILAYVHYFHPSTIILDEPDSHLHPNNQRLLCKLLQGVSEERGTQVFLTTHSRHVVDALSGQADFLWVRNGTAEKMTQDHDLAVLLDIGALDVKEMLSQSKAKCIVLTEDALKQGLEILLESSGLDMDATLTLAYYGCTSPHNLRPLIALIKAPNPKVKIVVHRDRDYLDQTEATDWESAIRRMGAEPFLTKGVDVESHFLNAAHLASLNDLTETEAQSLLDTATTSCNEVSLEKYINGRSDLEKKAGSFGKFNLGKFATTASNNLSQDPQRYRHSKTILRKLRGDYREANGKNLVISKVSEHIKASLLETIAQKI